jgi:hypothetical protein
LPPTCPKGAEIAAHSRPTSARLSSDIRAGVRGSHRSRLFPAWRAAVEAAAMRWQTECGDGSEKIMARCRPAATILHGVAFLLAFNGLANAAECLGAPNRTSPEGQHWFYRTDRDNNRKCWYLRGRDAETTGSTPTAQSAPTRPDPPTASSLSEAEKTKLFQEFLRWRDQPHETR